MIARDDRLNKSESMRLLRETSNELKGTATWLIPVKVQSTPNHVRSMGAHARLPKEKIVALTRNSGRQNKMFCMKSTMIAKLHL
jgi:hypothetical protein